MKWFISLVLCLFISTLFAQLSQEKGYIINLARDTVWGKIKYGTPAMRSVRVTFIHGETGETRKYFPFQIHAWHVQRFNQTFVSKVIKDKPKDVEGKGVFMERISSDKGPVRCYFFWNTEGARGYTQTYLEKNSALTEVQYGRFKKQMMLYFEDFPQLSDKIQRGAFRKKDLAKMVAEYNHWQEIRW